VSNERYDLCPTYINSIVVPGTVSNEDLYDCAKFRSSSRLPALTFYDKESTSSLWRCSQPLTGMMNSRRKGDEYYLRMIGFCSQNPSKTVFIQDSRPQMNAYGNRLKGGGFEDCGPGTNYPECRLSFANVENIHAVTKSVDKMFQIGLTKSANQRDTS